MKAQRARGPDAGPLKRRISYETDRCSGTERSPAGFAHHPCSGCSGRGYGTACPRIVEAENDDWTLWELPRAATPDLSNTTWNFSGGYIDGQEMTQAEMDASLAEYGGKLQFQFDANGGATMIQGGGTVQGTYQYLDDGSVGVIFDYNGEELRYACIFGWTEEDELLMVAISNIDGKDGVYFVQ